MHTQGCSILHYPFPPFFPIPFCLSPLPSLNISVGLPLSMWLCWRYSTDALHTMRERLDQLGAVSHLITRCKWNGYTCLIFSGSRNVRLAQDGIKQHCQRKWTQGFLSYFTSYWVTVTIYFTAVGRLVWKCSVMPLRMEGESRKKCEGYCSDEALYLFLSSVTKLYCLNKALLFIGIFFIDLFIYFLDYPGSLDSIMMKHKSGSWQTHNVVKYNNIMHIGLLSHRPPKRRVWFN